MDDNTNQNYFPNGFSINPLRKGPQLRCWLQTFRAAICNMTVKIDATTSLFRYNHCVKTFLNKTGHGDWYWHLDIDCTFGT
ncbi:hypothetical protein GN956_G1878 [Arapaima gigas]